MDTSPTVTLVIVNLDGREHLTSCLNSVAALDYPSDRFATMVVDNGSTDGSLELLRDRYPWVRVLSQQKNLGFAEAVNIGARAATSECLGLVNNDMRLDAGWLREVVRVYDPAAGTSCVAGLILDWEGERVDFIDGFVNLHGFAGQTHFGKQLLEVEVEDRRELPFACGGSMLVGREVFLDLGGFDPAFFALLEDVDFGWRLRLAGHGIRLAAGARSFHRHGATTQRVLDPPERLFLFERNALLMLLKNVGDANLGPFLAFALFLLAARAAADPSQDRPAPGLLAVDAVLRRLDEVLAERARVQALRSRGDEELVSMFGQPLLAVSLDETYLRASALLVRLLGLDKVAALGGSIHADPTFEIRQLLGVWQDRYGVGRSPAWHLRRGISNVMPDWLRHRWTKS